MPCQHQRAGIIGASMAQVSRTLVPTTWSSRFVVRNFWADPNSGVAYQVQVQIPQNLTASLEDVGNLTVIHEQTAEPLLRDIGKVRQETQRVLLRNFAEISKGVAVAQYDRYNMERLITVRANVAVPDLGGAAREVERAIAELGPPPPGVNVQGIRLMLFVK